MSVPVLSRTFFEGRRSEGGRDAVLPTPRPDADEQSKKDSVGGHWRGTEIERQRPRALAPSPRPGTMTQTEFIDQAATHPAPQSQSLSRSYGSDLPTSLTYIILSTRGSSPWRPAADMGTNRRDTSTWPSPGFSRSEE